MTLPPATNMALNLFETRYLVGDNYWSLVEQKLAEKIEQELIGPGPLFLSVKIAAEDTARAEAKRIVQAARAKYDLSGAIS